ncbi:hypothetical protein EVAR_86994_1 [Eumeta japonica]|uniref:Uncharacterized protein n=1 Tax=Eumeta variegata TaxID=151549 RepID=A0A4C1W6Q0_EUMVA|nr:hypothetical protein EVAR_86994_1 [Eumeta japonica]
MHRAGSRPRFAAEIDRPSRLHRARCASPACSAVTTCYVLRDGLPGRAPSRAYIDRGARARGGARGRRGRAPAAAEVSPARARGRLLRPVSCDRPPSGRAPRQTRRRRARLGLAADKGAQLSTPHAARGARRPPGARI